MCASLVHRFYLFGHNHGGVLRPINSFSTRHQPNATVFIHHSILRCVRIAQTTKKNILSISSRFFWQLSCVSFAPTRCLPFVDSLLSMTHEVHTPIITYEFFSTSKIYTKSIILPRVSISIFGFAQCTEVTRMRLESMEKTNRN